jgi:hypothetical protein
MDIRNYKIDYLSFVSDIIVLDGQSEPDWYYQQMGDLDTFIKQSSTFEIIEFLAYAFRKVYPNHSKFKHLFSLNFKDVNNTKIALDFDRSDIISAEWKYYLERKYYKKWDAELVYKHHLQKLTMGFTQPVMAAKDHVIRGLEDRQYQLTSTANHHLFKVADSPIDTIELRDNLFILTVNEAFAKNYTEMPGMLEE